MTQIGIEIFSSVYTYLFVAFLVGMVVGMAVVSLMLAGKDQRSAGDFEMLKHLRDNEGKAVRN